MKNSSLGEKLANISSSESFRTYSTMIIGSMILALGYTFFMTPYKIVPGGIYGISTILNHKFGFPIGLSALFFNLPLSLYGMKILGKQFGKQAFICFIVVALCADGYPWLLEHVFDYPHHIAIDPFQLVPEGIDTPGASKDGMLLASVIGGAVVGVGLGFLFKSRSASGGTDVVSLILHHYTKKSLGTLQMIVDSIIVVMGFIAFPDWKTPFCSLIAIFVMGKVVDVVIQGYSQDKTFFIVSENKIEEIRQFILNDLGRGGSIVPVNGMWNRVEKEMIITVVNRKEVDTLQRKIMAIDPMAFTMIMDVKEVVSEKFIRKY